MGTGIKASSCKKVRRSVASAVLLLALGLTLPPNVPSKEHLQRRFDQSNGLPVSEVTRLAQDTDGFLWIGTRSGLVRFDGNEMRVWAPDTLAGEIVGLTTSPKGEVITGIERGDAVLGHWKQMALYLVTERGAEPLRGPDGNFLVNVTSTRFTDDGSLWIARSGELLRRSADGSWAMCQLPHGEQVLGVETKDSHSVLIIGESGLWQVDPKGTAQKIVTYRRILGVLAVPDGSIYFFSDDGLIVPSKLMKLSDGRMNRILELPARPLSLARRGHTVWAAFDRFLVALRPGEPPEIIGPNDGLPSGGPLLADQEASLWLGTFQGLLQFPEPDTAVWNHRDGLPSQHTTFLAPFRKRSQGFWVATWQGLGRMHHTAQGWRATSEGFVFAGELCPDSQGRLWLTLEGRFREHSLTRSVFHSVPGLLWPEFCTAAPDGTVWVLAPMGLFRSSHTSRAPQLFTSSYPVSRKDPGAILHDSRNQLWISEGDMVCDTDASQLTRSKQAAWNCRQLSGAGAVFGLVELQEGELWAATEQNGVWRYRNGQWSQFPASTHPPYQKYGNLRPSAMGGCWLLSEGGVARAMAREDIPEGWQVVERLSSWQGVPTVSAIDLLEDLDGSLWIATVAGVIQVPAHARKAEMPVPHVRLVDVISSRDDLARTSGLRLAYRQFLELHFAALSFRDRSRLRYQMRMHHNEPWQAVNAEPVFRFADLRAGEYEVEVQASLDGEHWSTDPARFRFDVLPPWYRQNWALTLFVLALATLLYAAYRARLAVLLRMERQRARIAMDLHDEMGSGLGSIRLLAGLVTDKNLPAAERVATANEIAEAAGEMGTALAEIVWSLRPGSGRLDSLAAHLVERAARLFPGELPKFRSEIPEPLPPLELSLALRRAVALIALEAMYNAARHANATHVTLELAQKGRRWKLNVSDDGRGLRLGDAESNGMGLRNMKERAREIGAELTIAENAGGGTTVSLVFMPQA